MKLFPLTVSEFEKLHKTDRLSISEIARRLNINVAWISIWARRNNIKIITKPTQSTNITKEMLEVDCNNGLSTRGIAKRYSISKSLVGLKLQKFGLKTKPKPNMSNIIPIREKDQSAREISDIIKYKWSNNQYKSKVLSTMHSELYRNRMRQSVSLAFSNIYMKQYLSDQVRLLWQDDEYRNRIIEIINSKEIQDKRRISISSPDYLNKMNTLWRDPEYREHQRQLTTEMWKNKEYREKVIKRAKELWLSAEYKSNVAIGKQNNPITLTKPHVKILRILDSLNIEYKIEYPIGPYNFDIFIPTYNILIEIQGDYWHNLPINILRDKSKSTYIDEYFTQYQLKYIWEHECLSEGKVLEKIKYWLGITKMEVIDYDLNNIIIIDPEQNIVDEFLYNWHYIHHGRHGIDFGGYLNNELIIVTRFTSPSRQEIATSIGYKPNEILELSRLCVHPRYQRKNLCSWFLSRVEDKIPEHIKCLVSFADTSYGHIGTVYKAANWKFHSKVPPGYYYVDQNRWVMHKKTLWNHAKKMRMTESEFATKYGYTKIWGKEKLKFIKELK